jgi:uncharacterized protein (TIGR00369 family)
MTEEKQADIRASFARQGLMQLFGATITEIAAGRCAISAPFSKAIGQQDGYFHGGAVGAIADAAGGYAAMSLLPLGVDVLTLEYKINFIRPAAGEALIATGEVLKAGKTMTVVRIDVQVQRDGEWHLCAAMQQTIATAPRNRS